MTSIKTSTTQTVCPTLVVTVARRGKDQWSDTAKVEDFVKSPGFGKAECGCPRPTFVNLVVRDRTSYIEDCQKYWSVAMHQVMVGKLVGALWTLAQQSSEKEKALTRIAGRGAKAINEVLGNHRKGNWNLLSDETATGDPKYQRFDGNLRTAGDNHTIFEPCLPVGLVLRKPRGKKMETRFR